MEKAIRFSVSLPEPLLDKFDELIKQSECVSRSEFIRDLIREQIAKETWNDENKEVIAVLVIAYDHHEGEVVMRKMRIEHDANIEITCTNHVHIDHCNCLETIILKGLVSEIEHFSNSISGLKGVKFAKLTRASVPKY